MSYDLPRALRLSAGRALLAASRVLARHGAHLIGHPSTWQEPSRPGLRVVHTPGPQRAVAVDEIALLRRLGGFG